MQWNKIYLDTSVALQELCLCQKLSLAQNSTNLWLSYNQISKY